MNANPRRDVEGAKIVAGCMNMYARANKLEKEKGQQNGDATKVIVSVELETNNELMPKVEKTGVGNYIVLGGKYRLFSDGRKVPIDTTETQRKMYEARMREQQEQKDQDLDNSL